MHILNTYNNMIDVPEESHENREIRENVHRESARRSRAMRKMVHTFRVMLGNKLDGKTGDALTGECAWKQVGRVIGNNLYGRTLLRAWKQLGALLLAVQSCRLETSCGEIFRSLLGNNLKTGVLLGNKLVQKTRV